MKLKLKKHESDAGTYVCEMKQSHWTLKDGITQSLLGMFLTCPELVKIKMVDGWSPLITAPALAFGTVVHDLLEEAYSNRRELDLEKRISELEDEWLTKRIASFAGQDDVEKMQQQLSMARYLLPEYFRWWEEQDSTIKWLNLEHKFDTAYKGYRLRGKFDGVFEDSKGKLWIMETKTISRLDEDALIDRLPFNLQIMFYMIALERVTGRKPSGVLYNVIGKPQLRQKTSETPEEFGKRCGEDIGNTPEKYFRRYEVAITRTEMKAWEKELESIFYLLTEWVNGKWHYRNSLQCPGKFSPCECLPICARQDYTFFQKRDEIFRELGE